jgi:hypothetical protein
MEEKMGDTTGKCVRGRSLRLLSYAAGLDAARNGLEFALIRYAKRNRNALSSSCYPACKKL